MITPSKQGTTSRSQYSTKKTGITYKYPLALAESWSQESAVKKATDKKKGVQMSQSTGHMPFRSPVGMSVNKPDSLLGPLRTRKQLFTQ